MWPFSKKEPVQPAPKQIFNAKKALITIDALIEDDTGKPTPKSWKIVLHGYAMYFWDEHPNNIIVKDAESVFQAWRNRGKTGMLHVGGSKYVPTCKVNEINVTYEDHMVEAAWLGE